MERKAADGDDCCIYHLFFSEGYSAVMLIFRFRES
jgi:hypothetical protein